MSAGRRELPPETFDKPCFDKTSVFCYEGVTFKMDCTELILLGGWFAASRGQPILETWIRSQWEPGGAMFLAGVPHEGALVLCGNSTPKIDVNLFIVRQISWTALIYCVLWAEMKYHHFVSPQDYFTRA